MIVVVVVGGIVVVIFLLLLLLLLLLVEVVHVIAKAFTRLQSSCEQNVNIGNYNNNKSNNWLI